MSQDYETKRTDLRASRNEPGGERAAAEDPLVELARIVHKNKQSGANVSSGRVGSTDYFAGLEDVAVDPAAPSSTDTERKEPSFAPVTPAAAAPVTPVSDVPVEPVAPAFAPTTPVAAASGLDELEQAFEPGKPAEAGVSSLWPDIQPGEQQPVSAETPGMADNLAAHTISQPEPQVDQAAFGRVAANDQNSLAPTLSIDLEQNLTAELEDELIGALRQSVDDTEPVAPPQKTAPEAGYSQNHFQQVQNVEPDASEPEFSRQYDVGTSASESYRVDPVAPRVDVPQPESIAAPVNPAPRFEARSPVVPEPVVSTPVSPEPAPYSEPRFEAQRFDQPVEPVAPVSSEPEARPRIDENDLFAALNPEAAVPAPAEPVSSPETAGEPAGIDALFADLDFPPPGERNNSAAPAVPAPEPETQASAADIDDMTWPAAAAEVPRAEEDETPPPPEGYDLDAVARAMQESDPSLTGAGVLPPHSDAEKEAVPQAREKSRRGLFVAAGVMGVAVLGAAGFFLIDGDGVAVPSGPPPVISGLQEPLKIYPEESPAPADTQTTKMIYDRVNDNNGTAPSNLVLPETPQPADLPPAPAGTNGGADLVPGAPKRVRTVIVRPDGTFVSENDQAAAPAVTPAPAVAPAPAATPEPAAPSNANGSRVVATTPITGAPQPAEPSVSVSAPEPAVPAPSVAETPAIVAGTSETDAVAPEPQAPAEIVSVLPRKKPAAPVQIASAPPAATTSAPAAPAPATPAPATQNSGPLNLNQQASAPAATPAPAGSTGTIASGTYIVQVTSQRSAAAASDAYSGLQRRFPAILGNRNAVIVSANVQDRGVFYRARIPTTSREEAISLCESLQGAGGDCFVRRQP